MGVTINTEGFINPEKVYTYEEIVKSFPLSDFNLYTEKDLISFLKEIEVSLEKSMDGSGKEELLGRILEMKVLHTEDGKKLYCEPIEKGLSDNPEFDKDVERELKDKWESIVKDSERYQRYRDEGLSHEEAYDKVAKDNDFYKEQYHKLAKEKGIEKGYFSEKERKKLAKEGEAMPNGSFPIEDVEDLENAIHLWGRAKDPEAAKKWIIKRAKEMGETDRLPKDWDIEKGSVSASESGTRHFDGITGSTHSSYHMEKSEDEDDDWDDEDVEKGKKAQLGEIREWNGKKYRKEASGWVPVKEEGEKQGKDYKVGDIRTHHGIDFERTENGWRVYTGSKEKE